MSIGTQYLCVFVILAGIIGWLAYKLLFKKPKVGGGSCCGCSLSEKCSRPDKGKRKEGC